MSPIANSPRLLKCGLVLVDPVTSAVKRVIVLQYNPELVTRTLEPRTVESAGADRADALRLRGPAAETIRIEAELDATDALADGDEVALESGIHPQLAALETVVYPTSGQLVENHELAGRGLLEILPMQAPLTLFVWSRHRVVPVRITEFSITEQAFDAMLNPIRAKVELGMRVLSVDDLGFTHRGGGLYLGYQQKKEQLAALGRAGVLGAFGIDRLP
jgi:hypothetical protein